MTLFLMEHNPRPAVCFEYSPLLFSLISPYLGPPDTHSPLHSNPLLINCEPIQHVEEKPIDARRNPLAYLPT